MFDHEIESFLQKKKPGTSSIYRAGLQTFEEYYKAQGSIADFLDRLEADRDKGWREKKHVATEVITGYVEWLQKEKNFQPKTTRSYVGAIQQLARYNGLPFSTRDTKLPVSNPTLKKHPWTIEEVSRFFGLFEISMYRSFGILIFQSFLDYSTASSLLYRDIQKEYEAGVVPLCLDCERIKTEIPFVSFIGKWGVSELHKWLDTRTDLKPDDPLFPSTKQATADYFRKKASVFLNRKLTKDERNPCGTHSFRASGSTLARDNSRGDDEHVRAVDRYLDFFMGKTVEEQKRVYMSKSREGWRQTWQKHVEPFVTPKTF
jgi:integrase